MRPIHPVLWQINRHESKNKSESSENKEAKVDPGRELYDKAEKDFKRVQKNVNYTYRDWTDLVRLSGKEDKKNNSFDMTINKKNFVTIAATAVPSLVTGRKMVDNPDTTYTLRVTHVPWTSNFRFKLITNGFFWGKKETALTVKEAEGVLNNFSTRCREVENKKIAERKERIEKQNRLAQIDDQKEADGLLEDIEKGNYA